MSAHFNWSETTCSCLTSPLLTRPQLVKLSDLSEISAWKDEEKNTNLSFHISAFDSSEFGAQLFLKSLKTSLTPETDSCLINWS